MEARVITSIAVSRKRTTSVLHLASVDRQRNDIVCIKPGAISVQHQVGVDKQIRRRSAASDSLPPPHALFAAARRISIRLCHFPFFCCRCRSGLARLNGEAFIEGGAICGQIQARCKLWVRSAYVIAAILQTQTGHE